MKSLFQQLDMYNIKQRNRSIDLLKLYAMLSVTLDHSLQHWLGENIQNTQLYNWIFLSQMPIFMFASGYFIVNGINKSINIHKQKEKIIKLICSLIIPFISYGIIASVLTRKCILLKMFLYPDYSLWFLWSLFWMQLFMMLSQSMCTHLFKGLLFRFVTSVIIYVICLACIGVLYIMFPDKFDTKLIIYYSLFFLFGYLYSFCEKRVKFMRANLFKLSCIPVMIVVVAIIMIHHPNIINDSETTKNMIARIIGSVASILLMMNLCNFASKVKVINMIASFGILSLEMYYIHLILLMIPFISAGVPNYAFFVAKYCALVVLTIVIILVIKSNWITDLLFFGKLKKGKRKTE